MLDLPKPDNARSGFFSAADLVALMVELPAALRPLVPFFAFTGWRRDEARLLTWEQVNREGEAVRLTQTKSGEPRVFPYGKAPALRALLDAQWEGRDGLYVFQAGGQPIGVGKLRSGWQRACRRAGLEGRLVHDLRRTVARDMRRAGLSESDIMELCGWETRSMFDRYNIIDEADLAAAVSKRFNGKVTAKSEAPTASSHSLSSSRTS